MEYKEFAIMLAKEAGSIMRSSFFFGMSKEWKEDNTPVTKTDLEINDLVIKAVRENFPSHAVVGEEASHEVVNSTHAWVCDPVDGTRPFSLGIPTSVFALALVQEGQPILAVVYDPFMDRLYYAEKGKGAFLNGQRIQVSTTSDYKNGTLVIAYWKTAAWDLYPAVNKLAERGVKMLNIGSAIYHGMLVAVGESYAAIFPGKMPHDAATVKLIVEEAGGKVTDLFGNDRRYDQEGNGWVATNGIMHESILTALKETI